MTNTLDIPLNDSQSAAQRKSEVLVEALPWIRRFQGRTVVVKYGGNAMIDPALQQAFADDIVFMASVGIRPVVVHGGGPQINAMLADRGTAIEFRNGLRVTSREVMETVRMVLVGQVGRQLVGCINSFAPLAAGMSGEDSGLLSARRARVVVDGEEVDMGLVGDIVDVNVELIDDMLDRGQIPVIAPVCPEVDESGRPTGEVLNVNADAAATAIAQAIGAEKLVMLTNVAGIYRTWPDPRTLIPDISASDLRRLIPRLGEGMRPKAQALLDAVDGAVRSAAIVDGRIAHALLLEIFTTKGVGTMARRDDYV
ncbi:acetylglutamate kinase [Acidipropionibacterium timonense]|uniref:acetylglutamate kinase n=1 Tax=Acidipropionibacterium timonense TaxID=2161818 RepID=UPI00102F7FC7|nr:acetylglutamate kinase [Acidipropionibacterium timonense]